MVERGGAVEVVCAWGSTDVVVLARTVGAVTSAMRWNWASARSTLDASVVLGVKVVCVVAVPGAVRLIVEEVEAVEVLGLPAAVGAPEVGGLSESPALESLSASAAGGCDAGTESV